MLQEISGYMEKALKTKHTGSALSPLLWLNGIVSAPCLMIGAIVSSPMNVAFLVFAAVVVLYTMWQYHELRKIDPRLVQSEKLQFEMAKLDLIAKKGGDVVIDPCAGSGSTLIAAANKKRKGFGFEIKKEFYLQAKDWEEEILKM